MLKLLLVLCLLAPAWARPSAHELCKQGDTLLSQGKAKESRQKFEEAIRLDPRCAEAFAGRGIQLSMEANELLRKGDQKGGNQLHLQAIQDFSNAIRLAPKEPISWANRGNSYFRLNKFPQALSDLSQSLSLKSSDMSFAARARCYTKMGQEAKAIADYTQAYKLSKNANFLFNRADCYLKMHQPDKAKADYERVIRESKDASVVDWAKANLKPLQTPASSPSKSR